VELRTEEEDRLLMRGKFLNENLFLLALTTECVYDEQGRGKETQQRREKRYEKMEGLSKQKKARFPNGHK